MANHAGEPVTIKNAVCIVSFSLSLLMNPAANSRTVNRSIDCANVCSRAHQWLI